MPTPDFDTLALQHADSIRGLETSDGSDPADPALDAEMARTAKLGRHIAAARPAAGKTRMQTHRELRAAIAAAVDDAVERAGGVGAFRASVVVASFKGKASRTTTYRWVQRYVQSGAPTRHLLAKLHQEARARVGPADAPTSEPVDPVLELFPPPVSLSDILQGAGAFIPAWNNLRARLRAANDMVAHAMTEDGAGVRDPWQLLDAMSARLDALDEAMRLKHALRQEDYLASVLSAIADVEPAAAQRIIEAGRAWGLGDSTARWSG